GRTPRAPRTCTRARSSSSPISRRRGWLWARSSTSPSSPRAQCRRTRRRAPAMRKDEAAPPADPRSQPAVVAKVNALVRAKRHDEAITFLDGLTKSQGAAAPLLTILRHVYLAQG